MNLIHNIYPKSIAAMRNMRYLLIVILMGFFAEGYASHIIGGDLQYKCIGNDRYEITLVFVRDCENANPEATIDNPAIVSIYDENYKPLRNVGGIASLGHLKMKNFVTDTVYDISDNPCFALAGHLCVEKTVYRDTLRLPYREGGYRLAYQRCCRNYIVQNIMEPLYTGATYETYITGDALLACNEGPQLTHIPKLYTCVGQQFTYNQKYQESDGDSIVYSLCLPNAGASYDNPMPGVHPPGPFPNIDWEQGYSTEDMMNNPADPVRISPQGIITGTPLNTGTYLIGFCIEEYRDGKLLTVSNRDFEVTVLPCDEIPIADIGNEDLYCDGLEIEFINNSTGSQDFIWYFDTSDSTLSSTEPSPTFTYADPGCYEVKLLAFRDAECYDEVTKTICVYDDTIEAALEYDVSDDCTDSMTVYFYNLSEDLDYDIVEAKWEVVLGNDTTYLTGDTVFHTFNEQGTATVTLTVTSETGCSASITEDEILINFLSIDFIADTLEICKGESSNLFENGNPDYSYTYVPEAGLDLTESSNPIASPDTSTMYVVTLTDGICTITDSILVEVKGADFGIVDLSDTCSVEKILTTNNSDHSTIQWATDADFENIIGESDTLLYDVINQQIFYVSIVDTVLNCTLTNSIVVDHKGLAFNYPSVFDICTNDADSISVKNLTDLDFTIQWDDSPIITSDLDGTTIFLETSDVGAYDLRFFAEAENGCTYEGTIRVRVNASTEANFTFTNECGSLTVEFFNLSDSSSVVWDFGDGNTSEEENPTHIYSVKGNYEVTLTVKNGCDADITKTIRIDEYEINIPDEVINCQGDLTELNPGGDPSLNYSWTPFIGIDNPTSHNPRVSVSDSTWYYVTITDDNTDCESTDSVLVVPMIGVDADFAFANDCGSLVVDFTNLSDYTDVSWDFGDGNTSEEENPTHTYQTEGVYTVTLKVNDECGNKKIMELRMREYNVNIPDQVSDCFGEGASLNPDGNPNLDYSWSPTAGLDDPASHNPTAVVSDSTWYYVTITDNDSDCESKDSVLVIPVEEFIVTTSDDVSQCGTDPVVLQASSSEGTIDWYDDSGALVGSGTSIEITPGESDFYVATATYLDCQVSDTVFVELIDFAGLFTVIAEPEEIDFGETSQISVLGDTGDYTFSWSPRDGLDDPSKRNPVARPKVTTEYCVTISDEFDCETELCVTVVVRKAPCEPPYIFLPNAFSPNGDGTNDVLYMRGEAITDLELMIYNRWGQEVFRTSDKNIGWDGTNKNGEIQPTDVYGYYYKVQCGDEGSYEEKGNVSLIR